VVVGEDDDGGAAGNHVGEDFAGVDGALVEQTSCANAFICSLIPYDRTV
jgi:hypothetical protein